MLNTVSTTDLRRSTNKILHKAKQINGPIIIFANNKPVGSIVSISHYENIVRQNASLKRELEALQEHAQGKTQNISSQKDLETHIEDIYSYV